MKLKKSLKISFLSLLSLMLLFALYFFSIRRMDNWVASSAPVFPSYNAAPPMLLPSFFPDAGRFYLKLRTATGDTALAFGDTGGGTCMVSPAALDKLRIKGLISKALLKGLMPVSYIPFRRLVPDERIPQPAVLNSPVLRHPFARVSEPFLLVPPIDEELKMMMSVMIFDLFLGQNFFMGKSWTLDYPQQQIWLNTPLKPTDTGVEPLGFKKNTAGQVLNGHPRLKVKVDGEEIDMLFDTGATIIPADEFRRLSGISDKTITGSFIAKSIFDGWRQKHPDWKYYPKADGGRDVIEVPQVELGGQAAGPVLFAQRADAVWSTGMIATMDKVVKGAIGGSALRYYKVTIDYSSALIKFER